MAGGYSPSVEAALAKASAQSGVPLDTLRTFTRIESGGDPRNVTGSYKGLFQLSNGEFAKHGGGNIFDPEHNAMAGARKIASESAGFESKYGRQPTPAEIYLIHQQGEGGAAAHWANPDQPAWQSMASTGEGRRKGESWAKQAIWGNVPDDQKRQFGSVGNITSKQFTDLWANKFGGPGTPPTPAGPQGAYSGGDPDAYGAMPAPQVPAGGAPGGSGAIASAATTTATPATESGGLAGALKAIFAAGDKDADGKAQKSPFETSMAAFANAEQARQKQGADAMKSGQAAIAQDSSATQQQLARLAAGAQGLSQMGSLFKPTVLADGQPMGAFGRA